jgi:DNA-binding CsgD family transcriptional regulator
MVKPKHGAGHAPHLGRVDRESMRALAADLQTLSEGADCTRERLPSLLCDYLDAEKGALYRPVFADDTWSLEFGYFHGDSDNDRIVSAFSDFIAGQTRPDWGDWNASQPRTEQKNRALCFSAPVDLPEGEWTPVMRQIYPEAKLIECKHLAVVLCQDQDLLGWAGVFRREPFTERETELLAGIVGPLKQRLRWEQRLSIGCSAEWGIEAVLDATCAPTLLADASGRPVFANRAGKEWLQSGGRDLRLKLRSAVLAGTQSSGELEVLPMCTSGMLPLYLVTHSAKQHEFEARFRHTCHEWRLSPAQSAVLRRLIEGDANKAIAVALHCSVKGVEAHVAAIMAKARVGSRMEIAARFWQIPRG